MCRRRFIIVVGNTQMLSEVSDIQEASWTLRNFFSKKKKSVIILEMPVGVS